MRNVPTHWIVEAAAAEARARRHPFVDVPHVVLAALSAMTTAERTDDIARVIHIQHAYAVLQQSLMEGIASLPTGRHLGRRIPWTNHGRSVVGRLNAQREAAPNPLGPSIVMLIVFLLLDEFREGAWLRAKLAEAGLTQADFCA